MTLKTSEILLIDATIITGVFILLAISSAQLSSASLYSGKLGALVTLVIILPFTLSAVMVAQLELKKLGKKTISEES